MGGLRQGAVRWSRSGARLPVPLHAPGRDLEPPPDCLRLSRRDLPLQRLPPQRPAAPSGHDARYPRVHAPLSAACPAARLSPHSALRIVRERDTQGQHRPHTRTAGRADVVARTHRGRGAAQSTPALSLLRRAHAHHRDIRTMDAAACAAPRSHSNRGAVVTRQGSFPRHAVAPLRRQTTSRAPMVPLASSAPPIPYRITETATQSTSILAVIAWKRSRDAHPIQPSARHGRPPRHNQNVKSP
jgi:hypothetical protein